MKALVIRSPHHMQLEEMEAQPLGPHDVRVRSKAVGICGTDLEIYEGQISSDFVKYPVVPGHEWSGMVVECGSEVTSVRPGDRVIAEGLLSCGSCAYCREGRTNLCHQYDQLGFTRPGGGAELVIVPARAVHRIPNEVSYEAAVLIEPAATVLRGIMKTPLQPGMKAVIIGPGTLGLLTVQLLKAFGVDAICLIGRRNEQLELGRSIGASHFVNSRIMDVHAAIQVWTEGQGADLIVETSGSEEAVRLSMELARSGGHIVLTGVAGTGKKLVVESDYMMLRDLTVHGIFSYTTKSWHQALRLLEARKLELEALITHRFSIDQYEEAFEALRNKTKPTVKIVMLHDGEELSP
ncbi:zinc-dependent alcohol dehydrogenase [Paenibacillus soyae]|jgi:2-desacetyl-2-hydroxyethyl bacteriochlorophyllide A dehydrogenase|uniref:Alcohol dehydrogenase catalytic domain-containing protein n=1 Tax=Paenibacillus soyae TaxID=2969249 RepID=A0A9X2SBF1_9BACL|nr:alcohol dehydrogenase catalytic domain-containing protein [Paenibacillus soyae]MCR2804772.1 alcohol dehydrogenase catalytic domain-containing protein [Paenibacillus soyae]